MLVVAPSSAPMLDVYKRQVPHGLLGQYQSVLEGVFGQGACYVLNIRNYGGIQVQEHL